MNQHKLSLFSLAALCAALLSGCYTSNTTKTPSGIRTSKSYALGIVSTNETDTMVSFDRCRGLLKPGRPGEEAMIDRDVYDKCFADAMVGVDPNNQLPMPTPVDLNGDGRPDAYQYTNGFQVEIGMYNMYPGLYWPLAAQRAGLGSYMPRGAGYHPAFQRRGAMVGYQGDLALAGTDAQIVTKRQFDEKNKETDEAIDVLVEEEDAHAKDIKRIKSQLNGK